MSSRMKVIGMSLEMPYRDSMCPSKTAPETHADYSRLTRRQAEKAGGVSRATLYRYRDEGKLSVHKDDQGQTFYDAAELARVFPDTFNLKQLEIPGPRDGVGQSETASSEPRDGAVLTSLSVEKRYLTEDRDRLREENERLRRELASEREKRESERADFMKIIQQNQEAVKQLTDQRQKEAEAPPAPRGFWAQLRRK